MGHMVMLRTVFVQVCAVVAVPMRRTAASVCIARMCVARVCYIPDGHTS
jgi:hypothetical protein